jgi:hypothetical protein
MICNPILGGQMERGKLGQKRIFFKKHVSLSIFAKEDKTSLKLY